MNEIMIKNVKDFELKHIFECGQCFRWKRENDGSYTGVIKEGVLNVKKINKDLLIKGSMGNDIEKVFNNYFDMERNYNYIKRILCKDDLNIEKATQYGYGIRILNQDPWETLISFIISAANNIPRISKTIENISKEYGEKVLFNQKEYYLFPSPDSLSKASAEDLRRLNLGFRDKYIHMATKMVISGEINLDEIKHKDISTSRKELMKIPRCRGESGRLYNAIFNGKN